MGGHKPLALIALSLGTLVCGFTLPVKKDSADSIADYRKWTKANHVPADMSFAVAVMCQLPTAKQQMSAAPESPHRDYFLTVFVNDAAKQAFFNEKNPKMPVGAVIVKEKLPARDAKTPELLTAMIKREAGYDPANGDWEYLVLSGNGTRIFGRGKISSCQSCHKSQKDEGYLYRSYMPTDKMK